jgi:D-alanyl-lipoteichoic acid acyltransferase DltB (MBOAT superfamily)
LLHLLLPVGVSFYTFQELSYTIDVYRGTLRARRDFLDFATFVCFFPQLVAGPIERASRLLPQVERERQFSWDTARRATMLMIWGYFKKLVIADNVGVIANKVFALSHPSFPILWAGVFAFGMQIYADFSAYSDIALGAAQWLGFDLMRNFDHPYMARGPADFWRRWHISLSSWFRDYVYIPLGGSRASRIRVAANVLATFLVSGLWHGASWNYVLWGLYHGLLLVGARLIAPLVPLRVARASVGPLRILAMFILVQIGWLMFRETEWSALLRDFTLGPFDSSSLDWRVGAYLFLLAFTYSVPIWVQSIWVEITREDAAGAGQPRSSLGHLALEAAMGGMLVAAILVFRSRTSLDFIYFQF